MQDPELKVKIWRKSANFAAMLSAGNTSCRHMRAPLPAIVAALALWSQPSHAMAVAGPRVDSDTVMATPKPSLWQRVKDYMSLDGGSQDQEKRLDMLGGVYYDNVWGLSASVLGMARYRMPGCSSTEQPSQSTLYGQASVRGFWAVGIEGINLWPRDAVRLNYELELSYEPSFFWGMGFENGNNDANKTRQHKHKAVVSMQALWRVASGTYLGPAVKWNYANAEATERPWLYEGQNTTIHSMGVGLVLEADRRDYMSNPTRGWRVHLEQLFSPTWLSSTTSFSTTIVQADAYRTVWQGGVLAGEVYGELHFGKPSWASMAQVGDSHRMRGYYEGQYRDKHMLLTQVELRQHLWGRHGMAVWLGGGTVFHDENLLDHLLPNFGVGYRFAFRRHMNIRLDFGVGRGWRTGMTININEAF